MGNIIHGGAAQAAHQDRLRRQDIGQSGPQLYRALADHHYGLAGQRGRLVGFHIGFHLVRPGLG